jgi:2-oxoacid:acceptor oxidoreductase gamma subunit (pyruvate/2-ketoisovalerate family)
VIEIRFHGRGGQGAVVASEVLATAFFNEGKFVQAFPTFGVERRGAPVAAFVRSSQVPIRLRCQIEAPDHVIVLDPTLVSSVPVAAGLKPGGWIVINSDHQPADFGEFLNGGWQVACVDASGIAVRHKLGNPTNPIVNTSVLGAFARTTGLLHLESVTEAIRKGVPVRQEANVAAARDAFEAVKRSAWEEVQT